MKLDMNQAVLALGGLVLSVLAAAPAFAAGDAALGERVARTKCMACHTVEMGGANKVGPNLFGITLRGTSKAAGYAYSPLYLAAAARMSRWDAAALDGLLTDPTKFLTAQAGVSKGSSKMTSKLPSAEDRADVISYLETLK